MFSSTVSSNTRHASYFPFRRPLEPTPDEFANLDEEHGAANLLLAPNLLRLVDVPAGGLALTRAPRPTAGEIGLPRYHDVALEEEPNAHASGCIRLILSVRASASLCCISASERLRVSTRPVAELCSKITYNAGLLAIWPTVNTLTCLLFGALHEVGSFALFDQRMQTKSSDYWGFHYRAEQATMDGMVGAAAFYIPVTGIILAGSMIAVAGALYAGRPVENALLRWELHIAFGMIYTVTFIAALIGAGAVGHQILTGDKYIYANHHQVPNHPRHHHADGNDDTNYYYTKHPLVFVPALGLVCTLMMSIPVLLMLIGIAGSWNAGSDN